MTLGLLAGLAADAIGLRRSMLIGLVDADRRERARRCGRRRGPGERRRRACAARPARARRAGFPDGRDAGAGADPRDGAAGPREIGLGLVGRLHAARRGGGAAGRALPHRRGRLAGVVVGDRGGVGRCGAVRRGLRAGRCASSRSAARAGSWSARSLDTLRATGPWLVAAAFAVYSSQWIAVIGFLPAIYGEAGVPARWSAVLTALAAAMNIGGNVLAGRWLQRGVPAGSPAALGLCIDGDRRRGGLRPGRRRCATRWACRRCCATWRSAASRSPAAWCRPRSSCWRCAWRPARRPWRPRWG